MEWLIAFILCTGAGLFLGRGRALWLQVIAVGMFMGVGFAIVERDPLYLIATVLCGAGYLLGSRQSPTSHGPATG